MSSMSEQVVETEREAVVVEDAALIRMMGFPVLEALPSRTVPYERVDPFILVHEGRLRLSDMQNVDTKHPHRGFDNLWYVIEGSASTGHSTGPNGAIERARLSAGALLALRTGRGAWHAESVGEDEVREGQGDTEFRGVLFWVNLARKDKQVEPSALVLQPEEIPVRREGDGIVRVLVGEGSPVQLGTPALILDVELPEGGGVTTPVPPDSRASRTCWRARLRSERTDAEHDLPSSSCSGPASRSASPMLPQEHGSCSWRGSPTGRNPCSTDRTWTRREERAKENVPHAHERANPTLSTKEGIHGQRDSGPIEHRDRSRIHAAGLQRARPRHVLRVLYARGEVARWAPRDG
jgi:redox-sensitive bicupin YhaK (pirin superfamily)